MAQVHPAWLEHQRKRFMRPDAHRYMRPDAARWMKDATSDAGPGDHGPWLNGESKGLIDVCEQAVDLEAGSELISLKAVVAELKWQIALRRFARKYRTDQPRVPAGNSDGGQWTHDGSSSGLRPKLHVAGMPRIPRQKPPDSRERTKTAKEIAGWLATVKTAVDLDKLLRGTWLHERLASIKSYLDAPKTLEELKEAAAAGLKPGYDRHHIVEQTAAEVYGYPRSRIDAPDNIVLIPRMKHHEITAWFQTKNKNYGGGATPREYLVGQDWDKRRELGLEALRRFGVLKP